MCVQGAVVLAAPQQPLLRGVVELLQAAGPTAFCAVVKSQSEGGADWQTVKKQKGVSESNRLKVEGIMRQSLGGAGAGPSSQQQQQQQQGGKGAKGKGGGAPARPASSAAAGGAGGEQALSGRVRVFESGYAAEEVVRWVGKGAPPPASDPAAICCFISIPGSALLPRSHYKATAAARSPSRRVMITSRACVLLRRGQDVPDDEPGRQPAGHGLHAGGPQGAQQRHDEEEQGL